MKPEESPIGYVVSVADFMQFSEWKDILSAPWNIEDCKPELINELLSHLTPDNVVIQLSTLSSELQR